MRRSSDLSKPIMTATAPRTAKNILKGRFVLLGSVSAAALVLAAQVQADDFTIADEQTETTTQTLGSFGDVGTVDAGGTIATTVDAGIVALANGVTVNNAGAVIGGISGIVLLSDSALTNSGTVAADDGVAIDALGNNRITNSGEVLGVTGGIAVTGSNNMINNTGTVTGAIGIEADGDNNSIINSGAVLGLDDGIVARGANNTIANSGEVLGIDLGIIAQGDNNTITNSGEASGLQVGIIAQGLNNMITNSGTATGSIGIDAIGDNNTITNLGTATGSTGIDATGDNNTIINSGTADGFYGVYTSGSNITITNSGTATGSVAINAAGDNNTITNSGEVLGVDGGIVLTGSNNTINNIGTATGSIGIEVSGSNTTITNSGTATGSVAIDAAGDSSTITNSGEVLGVDAGIIVTGSNNTINNTGTATGSIGIEVAGDNSTIANSGTATGVRMSGTFGTLLNSGTLTASAGADALATGNDATGTVVVNTGMIDGRVSLAAGLTARFDNSGRLGVSVPGAVTAHQISGTYVQTAQGTLGLQVGATVSDTLQTNTAQLDGTLATTFTGETFQRSYTIVTASQEITGAFASYTPVGLPGLFASALSYGPTTVTLNIVADVTPIAGLTPNELAVGTSLAGVINSSGSPVLDGLPEALIPLYSLDASQLPQALDALSGESYASEQSILRGAGLYSRTTLLGRLRQGGYTGQDDALALLSNGGPTLSSSTKGTDDAFGAQGTMTWGQAFGSQTDLDGSTDTSDVSSTFSGIFTGVDTQVETWLVGAAIGFTRSTTTVDDLSSSSDVDSLLAALYAGTGSGPWNLRLGAAYASNQTDSSRAIVYPGYAEQAIADYNSATTQLFAEVSYGLVVGTAAVEPFAGLAWINVDTDGFSETGATAGLSVASNSSSVTYGTLGVRAATSVVTSGGMVLQPRGMLAWQTASGDLSPSAQMAFLSAPEAGFTVGGTPLADNAALIEIGADLLISERAELGLSYFGQYADGVSSYGLQATMAWTF